MVQKALTTDMLRRPTVDDLLAGAWLSAHREEVHTGALVNHLGPNQDICGTPMIS